jgi:ABC-type transport system substrate-binding protein
MASFSGLPISCGDYQVVEMQPDRSRYRLKKFREIEGAPDEIELWNYDYNKLPGKPDVMMGGLFPKDKVDRSYYRTQWSTEPAVVFTLVLNDKAPIVHLPAFREAINLAMPREIMAGPREEIPAREMTLPGSDAYLGLPVRYDLIEAKRLWMTLPPALREQEYRITVKTNYPGPYFQAIESSLRSIGMKVTLRAKQMKDFLEADEQDLMLGIGMVLLRGRPLAMYQRFDTRQNRPDPFPTFAGPGLQTLLDEYEKTANPAARKAIVKKVAHYVMDQNLAIPMTYSRSLFALSPRVKYDEAWDSGVILRLLRDN